jgi:hypothetical protein
MTLTSDALRIIRTHGERAMIATPKDSIVLRLPDTVLRANLVKEGLLRLNALSKTDTEDQTMTSMPEVSDSRFGNVLDPMERISETLSGLIMALTFICSLGVATGADIKVQTMLIGALGLGYC